MPPVDRNAVTSLRRIRWAVRAVLTLGIVASVTANILHAQPNPIAQSIAAWPPVALLLTVELVGRVPVSRRLGWIRAAATAVIASIAAWVSYWHMVGVAQRYGEEGAAPYLIPLSVDGLVVVASVCLVELTGQIRAAGSLPLEQAAEPANPTPAPGVTPLVSLVKAPRQTVITAEIAEPRPIDQGKARRAAALAALARGEDPEQTATDAGVTVRTLQRWADQAAAVTRQPRGGARKPSHGGDLVPIGAEGGDARGR